MANVNGIDIQAFLKKVNQGGKANIGEAVKLFTEPNVVNSLFSNSDTVISIEKIATSDLQNIAHTSLNNVVMKDDNAELSENELNCAIQDIEEKIVKYAKKLESQERQEMGLTQDINKMDTNTEEPKTAESVPITEEFGDAEKEVPKNVREAVDRTVEKLAKNLSEGKDYAYVKCDADGATITEIHKKMLYKTDGQNSGDLYYDSDGASHFKWPDVIQVFVEYEYKGKIYKSKVVEKPVHDATLGWGYDVTVVDDEPEFE